MLSWIWLPYALFISCACAVTNHTDTETLNSNSHVPLFLSNISLGATTAGLTNISPTTAAQKVPSRTRNATFENYANSNNNNQQNLLELVRNIDGQLRNMRNAEMGVATIQGIFDSMQFTSSSLIGATATSRNTSDAQQTDDTVLAEKMQIFSRKLAKKLQRATHVVLELRDFFHFNITKLFLQRYMRADYTEDEEFDQDFDVDPDEMNGVTPSSDHTQPLNLYLSTFIQPCQNAEYTPEQNYNKQQIQILNYLKTDRNFVPPFDDNYLNENNKYSLEANILIADKIQSLKTTLSRNDATSAKLKLLDNHFKHIYFLSRSDHAGDHSEHYYYDLHFRHLYVAAIKRKFVCLLIDVGAPMNAELLEITKVFVANILQLLSETDFVTVITIADKARTMTLDSYPVDAVNGIYAATRDRRDEILNYVNNLGVSKALTNHSAGFEFSFKLIQKLENISLIGSENPIQFVYITRGLLANLSDAKHVLNVIANGQAKLLQPILINTCAVVLDEKRIMYERQFLNDISTHNYSKYSNKGNDLNTDHQQQQRNLTGKFFVLTKAHPETLIRASTAVFENAFNDRYITESIEVHEPMVDGSAKSTDALVAITHVVPPYGVVGINLYLSDLIEDVTNYHHQEQHANKNEFVYAFLIDNRGVAVTHPAFPRPSTQSLTPFPVDIGFLENATDFAHIRRRLLQEESGTVKTTVYLKNNRKTELMDRTYHWKSVLGIYVLCLVATTKNEAPPAFNADNTVRAPQIPTSVPNTLHRFVANNNMQHYQNTIYENLPASDLLYHRLDLISPPNIEVCRYFRQMATLDAATLFLSSSAFESPFTFLHNNRISSQQTQVATVKTIMAYIKDSTGLLANPGLRPQIRHEVNALYSAIQHLKKRHQDTRGALKNYIIRRYIATVNGVMQVYPGCLLSDNYDPTRRPWFLKAMLQPGKIVTTEPYLDAGGAGYIITLTHTIFEGKGNALHSVERDQPVAVVALDVPYAFYYKMILDTTHLCQLSNMKCLLFENEGYLIAHPSMLEPSTQLNNQRRPHEHLTHKEPYLVNDILNHKTLVRKLACAIYQNRTLQRYYVFNTSLTDIVTNVVHGERTKYAIALVRGSNIFAAVLNSTCDGGAFCPCSTIDRVCLNCNRMDQMDCECPCECPMEMDAFDEAGADAEAPFVNYTQQYAYCDPPSEHFVALPVAGDQNLLHTCPNINCDIYGSQNECLSVVGCEWCQQDLDGNGFVASFCTGQASCFNGVLSSLTPYGDFDDVDVIAAHGYNPGQKQTSYSAFGPVGGAVIVLGIVIGFAIYCYRHNLDAHTQDQFYMDSVQEENYGLPLSRFNFDDCQAHDDPPGGYDHPSAQRNLIHPADISPYHMSTGSSYRRPPNGESDHGYSTMTPHEDSSDHQCFTLAEPLLLNEKRHSKSDTLSISTSISSPTNRHQQQYHHPYLNQPKPTSTTKDARYNLTSPKKLHTATPSPARIYEQTVLPMHDSNEESFSSHYILAPVTVHRHMETSES